MTEKIHRIPFYKYHRGCVVFHLDQLELKEKRQDWEVKILWERGEESQKKYCRREFNEFWGLLF